MTDSSNIQNYFRPLTSTDKQTLDRRLEQYRDQLEAQGYEATVAHGENGFFAGVLVIDDEHGRYGFLEPDGSVSWLSGDFGGIGALGSAVAQNPTDELQQEIDGLENADIE